MVRRAQALSPGFRAAQNRPERLRPTARLASRTTSAAAAAVRGIVQGRQVVGGTAPTHHRLGFAPQNVPNRRHAPAAVATATAAAASRRRR